MTKLKFNLIHIGITGLACGGFFINAQTGSILVGAALGTWLSYSSPITRLVKHITEAAKSASLK